MKNTKLLGAVAALLVVLSFVGVLVLRELGRTTFEGEVVEAGGSWIVVAEFESDENPYPCRYSLGVDDPSEYRVGQRVRVTYAGALFETNPAEVERVVRIKPLD